MRNNALFGKAIDNVRKHRDIKSLTTEGKRNCLVYEPNYQTIKNNLDNLSGIEMIKTQIIMNK